MTMMTDDNDNLFDVHDNGKKSANLGVGILIPDLKYRFRVRYPHDGRFNREGGDVLTRQTCNCEIDYVNKTITLKLEQPAALGEMHDLITYLIDSPSALIVESMAGDGEPNYAITFSLCQCVEHEYRLDYAFSEAASHELIFQYRDSSTKNRDELS